MKTILLIAIVTLLAITEANASPDYILMKQTWWGNWKMVHVDKPRKKLNKWHYDSKTDAYYRMRLAWGLYIRIK